MGGKGKVIGLAAILALGAGTGFFMQKRAEQQAAERERGSVFYAQLRAAPPLEITPAPGDVVSACFYNQNPTVGGKAALDSFKVQMMRYEFNHRKIYKNPQDTLNSKYVLPIADDTTLRAGKAVHIPNIYNKPFNCTPH